MAKAPKPVDPKAGQKQLFLLGGVLGLLVGIVLFFMGLGEFGFILDLMTNPGAAAQYPDMTQTMTDAAGRAAPFLIIGAILALAGWIFVKLGLRKPKPKTVEEQVAEAVEKRLKDLGLDGGAPATPIIPPRPVPAPPAAQATPLPQSVVVAPAGTPLSPPAPTASNGVARCPTCGGPLVAGRWCRTCK